jgi:hypothetical protein
VAAIERRIGQPLADRVIRFKEGSQWYVATFYGNPELAKKNSKKIFTSVEDGGFFERIFNSELTAEKLLIAHQLKSAIDDFIRQFNTRKRRRDRVPDWRADYSEVLGDSLVQKHGAAIDQFMPQCAVFLCGTIFKDYKDLLGKDPSTLPVYMEINGHNAILEHIGYILDCAQKNADVADKYWPTLLKSNSFFNSAVNYIQGVRSAAATLT